MIAIQAGTANEVWRRAAEHVQVLGERQLSRHFSGDTVETKELLHVSLCIDNPRQRVVSARPINPAFAIAEVIWILAGGNELEFIKFWNPRMTTWSDNGKSLYGAYGYRLGSTAGDEVFTALGSRHRNDQLLQAYRILCNRPNSRQVVLQIWDDELDLPYSDGKERSKDVPCNISADLKVRDGKLHWMQTMRSNDLMWGTPYNLIQWTTLQEIVAGWMGLELGQYTVNTSSLHVYDNHYQELETILNSEPDTTLPEWADMRVVGYENWKTMFEEVIDAVTYLTNCQDKNRLSRIAKNYSLPLGYAQWVWLLAAEALRRCGHINGALEAIESAGAWKASWLRWMESQHG